MKIKKLTLGVQTNPGIVHETGLWLALKWRTTWARSFDIKIVNTDYYGSKVDDVTGYVDASISITYYSTLKGGKYLIEDISHDYPCQPQTETKP
jgi:hypothetical protein